MKFWKSFVEGERHHFSTVLIGQDITPRFIEQFKNEFGVIKQKRISYLKDEDTYKLIEEPILLSDKKESRYRSLAMNRIFDLTGGSPFYIQIFCDRLVNYMNRRKAMYITEADVENIKEELIAVLIHLPMIDLTI